MAEPQPDSAHTQQLLQRAAAGDQNACAELMERHRSELYAFVEVRLDAGLRSRLDASDVVQEAQLEASRRLADFLSRRPMSFRLWLRKTAYERIVMLRRQHLGAQRRAVAREVRLPERSSWAFARLVAAGLTPSEQVGRQELVARVRRALGRLAEADREILLLRYYERLSYEEAACLLDISAAAARQRHGRALLRLHRLLANVSDSGQQP